MAAGDKTACEVTLEHHDKEFDRIGEEQKNQWDEIEKRATIKEMAKVETRLEKIRDRPPVWCTALIALLTALVGWLGRGLL